MSADVKHEKGRIVTHPIEEEMRHSFIDYAMSVIVSRAIPDARDGLKPVQRRILYAMRDLKLNPGNPYKKCATVVGDVLGKYHPHGDSAVYEALVRLAQDFAMAEPLVDGQGNFGSIDGDNAAAYRYTECRLTPAAVALLDNLDRDTVDFSPNFDDRLKEPSVLPAMVPNLLLNGSTGIAVGMATRIPPFNLRELVSAIVLLCESPGCDDEEVYARIEGPDFPTGGLLIDQGSGLSDFVRTGHGLMKMRARMHVEWEAGGRSSIIITEIPYGLKKLTLVNQIAERVRDKKIEGINDLRDESGEDIRIVVQVRKDADVKEVQRALLAQTDLEKTFGGQLLALVGGRPETISVRRALEVFLAHRLSVIARRARHDLQIAERRIHIVEGLLIAIDAIERVVAIIRGSASRERARKALVREFKLSEDQANAILDLRLSGLTALDVKALRQEISDLGKTIEDLKSLLSSEVRQRALVAEETRDIGECFGRDRRTEIASLDDANRITRQAADASALVMLSAAGKICARTSASTSRSREIDPRDPVLVAAQVMASDTLTIFTDQGTCHAVRVADLLAAGPGFRSFASAVPGTDRNEKPLWFVTGQRLATPGLDLVFVTTMGQVKRTSASEYQRPRAGGIAAVGVREEDRLLSILDLTSDGEMVLVSRDGMAIRFPVSEVPSQGRTATGVRGMKLRGSDRLVAAGVMGPEVAIISNGGYAKRVLRDEFPVQGRGGLGVKTYRAMERVGGAVAGAYPSPFSPAFQVYNAEAESWTTLEPDEIAVSARGSHGEIPPALQEMTDIQSVHSVPPSIAGRVMQASRGV